MSFSNTFETGLLALIFNATTLTNIADNAASAPLTDLYVALHTADPTDSGTQSSSEATYTSYARVAVARTSGGWTVSGDTVDNTAQIAFPEATGGSNTITHFSVGYASSGATTIIMHGALTSSLAVSNGITPTFAIGALTATLD